MQREIDTQIGRVLNKLEAMGELDNTYVMYTADHGIAIGRHGFAGKAKLYEHTWRVPFIVKGPGLRRGRARRETSICLMYLLHFVILPMSLNPRAAKGFSFKPVLFGSQPIIRDVLYGVYNGGDETWHGSVKKGDWKPIQYDVMEELFESNSYSTCLRILTNFWKSMPIRR